MPFWVTLKDKLHLNSKEKTPEAPTVTKVTDTYRETAGGGKECINRVIEGENSEATFRAKLTLGTGRHGRRTAEGGREWILPGYEGSVKPKPTPFSLLGDMWQKLCDFLKNTVASVRSKISKLRPKTSETSINQDNIQNNTPNRKAPPQKATKTPVPNATIEEADEILKKSLERLPPGTKHTYTKYSDGSERLHVQGPVFTNKSVKKD